MSVLRYQVRPGAYFDSIVLMRLQAALAGLPGIEDAGVVMATAANLALLKESGLLAAGKELPPEAAAVGADDLLVAVRAEAAEQAEAALGQVDSLAARKGSGGGADDDYRPRSLTAAARLLPAARWVLVSVPGRHAAEVAEEALRLGKNVFLYSDNVPLEAEVRLKTTARDRGLLVMGPDCGTALVGGAGLGFANRVRRGAIGLVGASGTGLQAIFCHLDALGEGVSHALGTGGRDLSVEVAGTSALQGVDLLARDPETRVLVLVSKPPAPAVAARLLGAARACGKPVVVHLLGYPPPGKRVGNLAFSTGLEEAASLAVELLKESAPAASAAPAPAAAPQGERRFLRGLFSGGTLAFEALLGLRPFLVPLASNVSLHGVEPLADPARSSGHTVLDLGEDAFTVGRLHPMMPPDLRLRRLRQEAADPETAVVLLDVVLGDGSHQDPAGALAPAVEETVKAGIAVVVLVVGTERDPQDLAAQCEALEAAGAVVGRTVGEAVRAVLDTLGPPPAAAMPAEVPLDALASPLAALNVGLEVFAETLQEQGARALHLDWRPPAGGDEKLQAILRRMKG